ncbi:hypothetical protein B0T09DRAFT_62172 [Sordaria sp. MPI-SDFR-AT-0083]|nr:hypothetical protein B0T09DRAFT_62172 [Sordaria sp. MPI-SDFR-AT-0083]
MKHTEGHSDLAVQSYATCFLAEPDWPTDPNPWYDSPLSRRAWVMQEWNLSRRFFWSEEKSLHWRCREETKADRYVDVRPVEFDSYSLITSNWHRLMQSYSRMQLTFETDRLVALCGMVAALKTSDRKDQEYHFGICMDGHGTLSALFWELDDLHVDSVEVYFLGIPSWSWASIVGGKRFRAIIPSSDRNRYYYDDRGITAENNGTELHFCAPIGVVQLCLEEQYADHCRRKSASRYRKMSVYATTNLSPYGETCFGSLTLDYTIDISNCPPPSGFTRHVIPLVRESGIKRQDDRNKDYMLVVEPVNKPDGSRAYRRVGMGLVDQRFMFVSGVSFDGSMLRWEEKKKPTAYVARETPLLCLFLLSSIPPSPSS